METDQMKREPVTSSQIKSIGHDPEKNVLHVEFQPRKGDTSGQVYEYANVPAPTHAALLCADSKGTFLQKQIASNPKAHPFKRL